MEYKGIDVSEYNREINWESVKNSGIEFAILRAGVGRECAKQKDDKFEYNYSECKRVGIHVGAYHYSYAKDPVGAEKELDFFLKLIDGKKFEYPLCFDIEDNRLKDISKEILTDNVITFCGGLENAGYYPAVYCNTNWLNNNLEAKRLERFDLWLADWRKTPDPRAKNCMWQYYNKGHIVGIYTDVDLDISYKNYPELIKEKGLNGF